MIISNRFVRTYLFGSKVAGIHNKSFQCCVSTAKEGLFQKQSTIILEPKTGNNIGAGAAGLRLCGKVIYSSSLRTNDRFQFHDAIAKTLDEFGEEGCTLEEALEQILADLKRRGIAVETLNLAADHGQADEQFNLERPYANGEGVSQDDYAQAAVLCREMAEQGYPKAQLMLGELYDSGDGVPQDYAQAATWYRKAAEQGVALAQYNLGHLYYNGEGLPQDYAQAALWFRKAAEQGDAEAQARLGFGYLDGQGVPQDYAQAAFWLHKAAEQGNGAAQNALGILYHEGLGVPQDYVEACFWSDVAAANKPNAPTVKDSAESRDEITSHLTSAELAHVQQRTRAWFETHRARPQ